MWIMLIKAKCYIRYTGLDYITLHTIHFTDPTFVTRQLNMKQVTNIHKTIDTFRLLWQER